MIAGSVAVLFKPVRFWFMIPGMNYSSYPSNILRERVSKLGSLCCFETSIVSNMMAAKTTDNHAVPFNPAVIQYGYTGLPHEIKVFLIHHPFVIAERHEGRGDGSAIGQERQYVGLCLKRRTIPLWPNSIEHITCNADEIRMAGMEGRNHRCGIGIVKIAQQHETWRTGDVISCFNRGNHLQEKKAAISGYAAKYEYDSQ